MCPNSLIEPTDCCNQEQQPWVDWDPSC